MIIHCTTKSDVVTSAWYAEDLCQYKNILLLINRFNREQLVHAIIF